MPKTEPKASGTKTSQPRLYEKSLDYLGKHHWQVIMLLVTLILSPMFTLIINDWLASPPKETATYYYQGLYSQRYAEENGQQVSEGSSCQSSNVAHRSDAFRCFLDEGNIYDPCFREPTSTDALSCPTDPGILGLALRAEKVEITRDFRENIEQGPWFVVLDSNARCSFMTGATYTEADKRANYACDNDQVLYGVIDKSDEVWTIQCNNWDEMRLEPCEIKEAWF